MKRLNIFAWKKKKRLSLLGLEYFSYTLNRCKQPLSYNFWTFPAIQKYLRRFTRCCTICTILKNMKNSHGWVLLLVTLQVSLKVAFLHGCFSCFLNCTNGTKSRKASKHSWYILRACSIAKKRMNFNWMIMLNPQNFKVIPIAFTVLC